MILFITCIAAIPMIAIGKVKIFFARILSPVEGKAKIGTQSVCPITEVAHYNSSLADLKNLTICAMK